MDYDDENKENIDPELSGQGDCKENVPLQMKGRVIVPLAPSIVLRDARRGLRNREVRGGLHGNQDKEWRGGLQGNQDNDAGVCNDRSNDEDANVNQDNRDNDVDDNDIDKIRRSTEQLNISDGDHSVRDYLAVRVTLMMFCSFIFTEQYKLQGAIWDISFKHDKICYR